MEEKNKHIDIRFKYDVIGLDHVKLKAEELLKTLEKAKSLLNDLADSEVKMIVSYSTESICDKQDI